jgi:Tfp pilus assembly protein FimT
MIVALTKVARGASAMAEIMIVVTIIALLGVMALAGSLCARKHRKSTEIRRDLPLVGSAVDRYAP